MSFSLSPLWKLIYHKGTAQRLRLRRIDCWKCFSASISPAAVLIMIPPTPIHLNAVLGLGIAACGAGKGLFLCSD